MSTREQNSIHNEIQWTINSIVPFDDEEKKHINFALKWISTGAEIFRIAKPATPDPHLVAVFLLIDPSSNKVLS